MNIYDTANKLAQELKQSEEYVNYKMAKEALNLNPELKKKIEEFETARYEAQIVAMQTGKNDEEKTKIAQKFCDEAFSINESKPSHVNLVYSVIGTKDEDNDV